VTVVDIVLAEDIPSQQNLIQYFVKKYDASIKCAKDGDEAVWFASVYNPDIAILDLNMPVKDGFQATKQIKRINSDIKIIVSTAYASEKSVEKAIEKGADDYLVKPYTKQDLMDSIESVTE
jgi:two-component system cell cycle response regulator DivK